MPRFLSTLLALLLASFYVTGQSVLSSGNWYKLEIQERGVYRLSRTYLQNAGVDIDNVDPRTIKIYGFKGGMLPQSNATERPTDLVELSIMVLGQEDGRFDNTDNIFFYAENGDSFHYEGDELVYENNIYSDENYYFLTYGGANGRRIETAENIAGDFPQIDSFNDFQYLKNENYNLLSSGRAWYTERFNTTTSQSYNFSFDNIAGNSEIKVSVNVMAQAFDPSSFDISIGNNVIGNIPVQSVPDFTTRFGRYLVKGYDVLGVFMVNSNLVNKGEVSIQLDYLKNETQSTGFLNDLLVEVESNLSLSNDQLHFRSLESLSNSVSSFYIANTKSSTMVWDVSSHNNAIQHVIDFNNGVSNFNAETDKLREYIIFEPSLLSEPSAITRSANQNLKLNLDTEFLIIAHPAFIDQAIRLANFRSNNDGLNSKVVDIFKVYNEFSSGRQDVTAIRDYAKYLYDNGQLKYLLIFGRGSYDYKDITPNNTNFVPIYESRNSLYPLDTYASDDYFAFLEDEEGDWLEQNGGNHTMDIGVGRFPVKTPEEAKVVVDKIINYSTNPETIGEWRNKVIFVADDADGNLHHRQANNLSIFVDTTYSEFQSEKLFLDDFPQVSKPSGEVSPKASKALDEVVGDGALIVNFTGHGGESGWMQEQVLDIVQIQNWRNIDKLPLFVTATCEFARHDDPKRISGGELVVTSEKGGGIAIVSTCRPVSSASNFVLNKAFYEAVYRQENNQYLRLGDIFKITKNESVNLAQDPKKVGNRNFALLGDPTLRLSYPSKNIKITEINGEEAKTDTLKAQARTRLTGQVFNLDDTPDTRFNGEVLFTIYDKPIFKTTLGNENSPFTYKSDENIVFRGSAAVNSGEFDIEFIMPKNISQQIGNGKINMYAFNDGMQDANGSDIKLQIGGTSPNPPSDQDGPLIELFIGDTLNTNLNGVSHNTNLVAVMSDESGINLSSFGIGNNITVTLDDDETFIANEYYRSFQGDFTKGYLSFPLTDLSKGPHKATVKAWDVNNNSSEQDIFFTVADPNEVVIYKLENYPNPFNQSTNFRFTHNRAGDDLEVTLTITSPLSGTVYEKNIEVENSASDVDLLNWEANTENGQKLTAGIYIYSIEVRSIKDGAKRQAHQKLILIN